MKIGHQVNGIHGVLIAAGLLFVSLAMAADRSGGEGMVIAEQDILGTIGQVQAKFNKAPKTRIERGVRQVAQLWGKDDGDAGAFAHFCVNHFMDGPELDKLFERFESKMEQIDGHMNSLTLALRLEVDEELGPLLPMDLLFGQMDPGAHVLDDFFKSKLAFMALLNFPVVTLEEKLNKGEKWDRRAWAEVRLAERFAHRVPAHVQQAVTKAYARADNYIFNYNIHMEKVVDKEGKALFRKGLKLISHWGLRDELKAMYADPKGNLHKQEIIQRIMLRIVHQEIPKVVIGSSAQVWDPEANTVDGKSAPREPDTRFERLLDVFRAHRLEDAHYPDMPSHIDRRFKSHREIPEAEVEKLLVSILEAPASKPVAAYMEQKLGRKLLPFDIWYDGFKARASFDERELDRVVKTRYPTLAAFQKDLPNILGKLGFDATTARFLAEHIEVDAARGAGHAWGPQMRTEKAHLRTRVPKDGMDYKGFNIAMHELGHNVEQVFSLYRLDHTLLEGVPNTAFTEGFAFVFQSRDLDVLGMAKTDATFEAMKVLDDFWSTREIAGVGVMDMRVWRWMYEHPEAKPADLRVAVVDIAKDVWNKYYAPVFGVQDSPILAIYSHMINSGLYLPDYPLGHIIAFQIENFFHSHPLAREMERMCALGNLTPNAWMKQAVGDVVSSRAMIEGATKALSV
ncbi:MAG: hypothetical protein JRF33_24665, partial [Deltaproteobacteria bacterium]|nr:hypothetical protein [Deltaproteobacteria bacterium]